MFLQIGRVPFDRKGLFYTVVIKKTFPYCIRTTDVRMSMCSVNPVLDTVRIAQFIDRIRISY